MKKGLICLICCVLLLCGAAAEEVIEGSAEERAAAALAAMKVDAVIRLNGDAVSCDSDAVTVDERVIRVNGPGSFAVTGKGTDWQFRFSAAKGEVQELILCGAEWSCSFGPALISGTDLLTVTVADGTENRLFDDDRRTDGEDSPSEALIFGEDSLTLRGSGTLTLVARLGTAVRCKDYLLVDGPVLTVRAANDGLRGNDGVTVRSGSITLIAGGDGIQASKEEQDKGNIYLEGGMLNILAEKDALQAAGSVYYEGGTVTTRNGDGVTGEQ